MFRSIWAGEPSERCDEEASVEVQVPVISPAADPPSLDVPVIAPAYAPRRASRRQKGRSAGYVTSDDTKTKTRAARNGYLANSAKESHSNPLDAFCPSRARAAGRSCSSTNASTKNRLFAGGISLPRLSKDDQSLNQLKDRGIVGHANAQSSGLELVMCPPDIDGVGMQMDCPSAESIFTSKVFDDASMWLRYPSENLPIPMNCSAWELGHYKKWKRKGRNVHLPCLNLTETVF